MVLAMVTAACGQAVAPTATAPAATAMPDPARSVSPTPPPTATPVDQLVPAISGYPPERIKEMLAQNMFLPTMSWGAGETPQYGGQAVYSNKADPQNDDPMLSGSITIRNVFGAVTGDGGLVMYKRSQNDQFAGYLAESWTLSSDQKTWTFKLRPDVKWHDGTTVVADDIKWYIDVAVKPPTGRKLSPWFNILPGLKEVLAPDQGTVQLVFDRESPHLLEELSAVTYTIAHQRKLGQAEIDKGNVTFGMVALGGVSVGPFKWDKYTKGSSFRSVRFDQYWEKDAQGRAMPYLDSVLNVIITDKIVTLSAFRAGRLDAMSRGIGTSPDPDMLRLIKKSLGDTVWFHRYPSLNSGLGFNATKPPFDDVRVRRAVALYMDREEGCKKMNGGFCFGSGWTAPGVYWFSGNYVKWPGFNTATKAQDQEEAKKIIKDLGLVGTKVEQVTRPDDLFQAEFNEQILRSLGFDSRISSMDIQLHNDYLVSGKMQTYIANPATGGFPSPMMTPLVSTALDAGVIRPIDLEYDAWQKIILTAMDPAVRRKALWEAEDFHFIEKVYLAPHYREEFIQPYRTYLKGPIVPGWGAGSNNDRSTDWIDMTLRDKAGK